MRSLGEFTKIALNATKARALAKIYGLVPEAGTQWKWALRQLRKGKSREELGMFPEKYIKKILKGRRRAAQRGLEVGAELDRSGKIIGKIHKGGKGFLPVTYSELKAPAEEVAKSIHTHPIAGVKKDIDKSLRGLGWAESVAKASARRGPKMGRVLKARAKDAAKSLESIARHKQTKEEALETARQLKLSGKVKEDYVRDATTSLREKMSKGLERASKTPLAPSGIDEPLGGDVRAWATRGAKGSHTILDPYTGKRAIYKLRDKLPGGLRKAYFKA